MIIIGRLLAFFVSLPTSKKWQLVFYKSNAVVIHTIFLHSIIKAPIKKSFIMLFKLFVALLMTNQVLVFPRVATYQQAKLEFQDLWGDPTITISKNLKFRA